MSTAAVNGSELNKIVIAGEAYAISLSCVISVDNALFATGVKRQCPTCNISIVGDAGSFVIRRRVAASAMSAVNTLSSELTKRLVANGQFNALLTVTTTAVKRPAMFARSAIVSAGLNLSLIRRVVAVSHLKLLTDASNLTLSLRYIRQTIAARLFRLSRLPPAFSVEKRTAIRVHKSRDFIKADRHDGDLS